MDPGRDRRPIATSKKPTSSPSAGQAQAARAAAGEAARAAEAAGRAPRGRPSDVFGGEVRRRDIFTLLVFHLIARAESGASYGNQLIEQIEAITGGAVSLNPNTMYPLLRSLEGSGFIDGRWEHPEKRSRRLYQLTAEGRAEYERLKRELEPLLDSIIHSITLIKQEIYGDEPR